MATFIFVLLVIPIRGTKKCEDELLNEGHRNTILS